MSIPVNELLKYFKILKKRKYLFIILSLLIMSVFIWGSYTLPRKYKAESTIFIEKNVINKLVEGIAISPSMEDRLRVLKYALLSRGLVLNVMKDLNINLKAKNDKELEELIADYQKRTNLTVKGNDLFIVSILDMDPKLAMNYVNTLVGKYIEGNLTSKREEAYGANRFLGEQLTALKTKLDKAEDAVIKYRQEKGVFILTDEKGLIEQMRNYKNEIEYLRVAHKELAATGKSLSTQLQHIDKYSVSVYKHAENRNAKALEKRLQDLLVRYTENYPEVVRLRAEIESLKKQGPAQAKESQSGEPDQSSINPTYQEMEQQYLQLEAQTQANEARQRELIRLLSARESELRNIPESKRRLMELENERDSQKVLYDKLLQRQGQSDIGKQMEVDDKTTTFRIIDPAILPVQPDSPNRVKLILTGIFLGLAGGLGGVFIREGFDSSVKEMRTLKDLGVHVLAIVPSIANETEQIQKKKKDRVLYAAAGSYFLLICITLLLEALGISYVDFFLKRLSML
jgi:polysaccharide chain length determinant protein (PEP-CTERM system associated)